VAPDKAPRAVLRDNAVMSSPPEALSPADRHKLRTGLDRVWHAAGFSFAGLRAGWAETAFRQEAIAAVVLLPLSFWLGRNWVETALLAGSVLIVMTVELLNTGIEAVVDRIGPEWHDLSRRAKDMGSAAVLLSLVLCGGIWLAALYQRFVA
jgi:diacylglycerol kinase (ATP)